MNGHHYARLNNFHGTKRQLLGNQAGHAAPAWKTNVPNATMGYPKARPAIDAGSKIFLTRLPLDVGEKEVEELFRKTVGPLKESFLIYNSQGGSKGMAVVSFYRPGDALVAKTKYDGKIVDGRNPLKIEIITDGAPLKVAAGPPPARTLLARIGEKPKAAPNAAPAPPLKQQKARAHAQQKQHQDTVPAAIPVPPRRLRQKKGPKRIKKLQAVNVTRDQLDKEMEDYRASADMTGL
ncbi:hypothetical protein H0H81_012463 [Sphagnurus paluster]|uniref:RRM domain-containing protein n=1 Tax=Sphagnurus paluster TaxID=117069 RepID=A0A9P7FQJ4_9AGAR|nr:hypothetical protein H0H81_012463 [Sphagnurus paluster]